MKYSADKALITEIPHRMRTLKTRIDTMLYKIPRATARNRKSLKVALGLRKDRYAAQGEVSGRGQTDLLIASM